MSKLNFSSVKARCAELANTAAVDSDMPATIAAIAKAIPFPNLWPEENLAAPNISLRSALFGVSKRGRRRMVKEPIAAQDGYEITYAGESLDQADEDVWLAVLHHARRDGMGVDVSFSFRGLARALRWPYGGRTIERLRRTLDRLTEGTVELRSGRFKFTGHLIDFMGQDDETGHFYLRLSPEMARLFEQDQYTFLNADRRASLNSYLAKWLDGYFASHAKPYPVKLDTLRRLCGSKMVAAHHFRSELKGALAELQQNGAIRDWKIDSRDIVHIERNLAVASTQSLHIMKRSVAG